MLISQKDEHVNELWTSKKWLMQVTTYATRNKRKIYQAISIKYVYKMTVSNHEI